MEQTEVTVGVAGRKTGLSPYLTVRSYGDTVSITARANCRIRVSVPYSLALPGAGEPVCSIATLFAWFGAFCVP